MATLSAQAAARFVSEDLVKELHFDAERVVNSFVSPRMSIQPLPDVIAMTKGASVSIDFYPVGEDLDSTRKAIRNGLRKWGVVRIDNHNDPVKNRVWRLTFVNPSAPSPLGAGAARGADPTATQIFLVILVLAVSIAFLVTPTSTLKEYVNRVAPGAASALDSVVRFVEAKIGHKSV